MVKLLASLPGVDPAAKMGEALVIAGEGDFPMAAFLYSMDELASARDCHGGEPQIRGHSRGDWSLN